MIGRIWIRERVVVRRKRISTAFTRRTTVEAHHGKRHVSCGRRISIPAARTSPRRIFPSQAQRTCRCPESVRKVPVQLQSGLPSPPQTGFHGVDLTLHFHHGLHRRVGHLHPNRHGVRLGLEPQSHRGQQAEESEAIQAPSNGRQTCIGRAVSVHVPKIRRPIRPRSSRPKSGA